MEIMCLYQQYLENANNCKQNRLNLVKEIASMWTFLLAQIVSRQFNQLLSYQRTHNFPIFT